MNYFFILITIFPLLLTNNSSCVTPPDLGDDNSRSCAELPDLCDANLVSFLEHSLLPGNLSCPEDPFSDPASTQTDLSEENTIGNKPAIIPQEATERRQTIPTEALTKSADGFFHCRHCEYQSTYKCNVITHERRHTGDKPFQCPYCDYRAVRQVDVTSHERTHTGDKPFKCRFCNYSTADESTIRRHKRTHTGKKPFECQYCTYKFTRKSKLIQHERTHTKT